MTDGTPANRNAQSWDGVTRLARPVLAGKGGARAQKGMGSDQWGRYLACPKPVTANEIGIFLYMQMNCERAVRISSAAAGRGVGWALGIDLHFSLRRHFVWGMTCDLCPVLWRF